MAEAEVPSDRDARALAGIALPEERIMMESSFLREIQPILEARQRAEAEAKLLARQLRELLVGRAEAEPLIARLLMAPADVVERAASLAVRRGTTDELVTALDVLLPQDLARPG